MQEIRKQGSGDDWEPLIGWHDTEFGGASLLVPVVLRDGCVFVRVDEDAVWEIR